MGCGASAPDNMVSKADVKKTIDGNKVAIFSLSYCPYCLKVKRFFNDQGVAFKALEIDQLDNEGYRKVLLDMTSQRTFPNVFINGKHIGGCDGTFTRRMTWTMLA